MADGPHSKAQTAVRSENGVGAAAARIAEALTKKNVLAIISSDYRAKDIHAALKGACPKAEAIFFQPSDALPGDTQPPTPANTGVRLAALRRARELVKGRQARVACITTAEAASEMLPKPETFDGPLTRFAMGGRIDPEAFRTVVRNIGYFEDDRVDEPAEFAMRGRVIDIFPANAIRPVRIELNDGVIARIREFDSVSQRGVRDLPFIDLGGAAWPALLGRSNTLFDYFPDTIVALDPSSAAERARFLSLAADAANPNKKKVANPNLVSPAAWDAAIKKRKVIELSSGLNERTIRFSANADSVRAMNAEIQTAFAEKARVVIAGSEHDLRFIKKRLAKKYAQGARPISRWNEADTGWLNRVKLLEMKLDLGWREPHFLVVSAHEVLGGNAGLAAASKDSGEHLLEIGDICVGDVVIHEDHGIAVIAGLKQPSGASVIGEAIELEYAGGAKRLIPVEEADRIWKYGADRTAVTLDGLDGTSWRKRRLIIDRAMTETAADLTRLSKENAKRKAAKIEPDPGAYNEFVTGFPFSETPDQTRAINAVRDDLASGKPMDRLVVGDVGYGKTEVAMRAAALTALAGKQVVIAAPTTVLVRQHYETFKQRFERTGLKVASLSRLADTAERKRVKAGLADGSISVVVGTGAVASKDVEYAKLGLVVIDEEQRFGAADKAKLRDLGDKGHLLSLTATPIPRTLQNALLGLKQLSVIATPPARRQPIRTLAGVWDEHQVRTALLREKDRGGQSFVVVPRITDIETLGATLKRLTPELSFLLAHGEMAAADIDESMVRFASGHGDVLLATNIIEAGLDVPRANTMVVWRADRFGLAQLHQLRGRVGRGNRRGHILLSTEPGVSLTEATKKRLRTLESLDRLGAGFAISARDLDIRGAGDLMGDAQSGHMKLIGIDLYQHLLERAVREARGETLERWTPVINLGISGRIPPDWIPEADTRLSLYLRLARLTTREELDAFEDELIDRFGEEPDEAATLLRIANVRTMARNADIAKVDGGPSAIAFTQRSEKTKKAVAEAGLVAKNERLLLQASIPEPVGRLAATEKVLKQLGGARKRA
ncbi:MAG TPA: DEAD/DEAH box helicase [Hyphomonadaceae bacterium]|jgi:transcription-repair coupling factor (superfamily II helicase)|nr:DEAD/DEAH box helicase [Hyphomonadaceae bacterium]